jgi:hypothetical protein
MKELLIIETDNAENLRKLLVENNIEHEVIYIAKITYKGKKK